MRKQTSLQYKLSYLRERLFRRLAKKDDTARRLMTVPGVGPVVALAYISVIDDPKRFNPGSPTELDFCDFSGV